MANPQSEHGHTRIANEIMDALARTRIPGEARQVLDLILRETYGCSRKCVKIKAGFIAKKTGLKRQNVSRAIKKLEAMNLLSVIKNDYVIKSDYTQEISFNKNYEKWGKSHNVVASSKTITPVINIDSLPYKATIKTTKEIQPKKKADFDLKYPGWFDKKLWAEYKKHRQKLKAPLTPYGEHLAILKLEKLISENGTTQNDVICQSIECGWKGLFPVKENNSCNWKPGSLKPTKEEEAEEWTNDPGKFL